MNRYYVYEYLRRHGEVSDYELVTVFERLTSEEIFEGKCLYYDYKEKAQAVGRQPVRSESELPMSL